MNIILLSGGSGKRLWPLSNDIRSKQFIKIFKKSNHNIPLGTEYTGELESMVQRIYGQIKTVDLDATVTIATSKSQVSAIHNQLGSEVGRISEHGIHSQRLWKSLLSAMQEKVMKTEDYSIGLNGLPKSDVLKFFFAGTGESGSIVIRPSGTEPKLKTYVSVTAEDKN